MAKGAVIRKFAQTIGLAVCDIERGDHVHTRNVAFHAVAGDYAFGANLRPAPEPKESDSFMGYRRADGSVETRNYIAIVTSVNCSATAARMIADHFTVERLAPYPEVDDVVAFVHGTGCGMAGDGEGSDAWSGVTANPALGYACDLLVARGGTGGLAETPEIYGAEHLLTRRAADPDVGRRLVALIDWREDYTRRNRATMDNNPGPGNKAGGLATILEKSLGAATRGGAHGRRHGHGRRKDPVARCQRGRPRHRDIPGNPAGGFGRSKQVRGPGSGRS